MTGIGIEYRYPGKTHSEKSRCVRFAVKNSYIRLMV